MDQALTGLQWAVAAALAMLGAVTIRDWVRNRDATRLWLAVAVGSLGAVGVLGRIPPTTGAVALLLLVVDLALFMGSAFAFFLFRNTLIPSKPRTVWVVGIVTLGLSIAALVPTVGPSLAGQQNATPSGGLLTIYIILLLTWAGIVASSILRLSRGSGALPSVQRARLLSLNAGFAGLVFAIVASVLAAGLGTNYLYQIGIEVVVLLCMPLLLAAFSPPAWLRRAWREREEVQYRQAINNLLLYSPDAGTLANRALEWAARLVGGGSALIAVGASVIATPDLDAAATRRFDGEVRQRRATGLTSFVSSLGHAAVVPIPSRSGDAYLAVLAGPFTPLFGDEELQRLGQYAVSVALALDRVHLTEGVRRNAELLDLAYDAVFSWDWRTRGIQYWNRAATEVYGYTEDEVIGKDPQVLLSSIYPVPLDQITAALAEYGHWEGELLQVTKDGRQVPISARWALQRDSAGDPLSVLEINRDVSAEKAAADELRRARDVAESASNAKSEYLSRMSHELRTPLAAMLGFSDLLEMREPRDDQMQAIGAIQRAGSHLLSLVNDVLDIARIESGRESLSLQPVDICAAVTECMGLVGAAAAERNVSMRLHANEGDTVFVTADRQRLNQVLLNLLTNAVKYGAEGGHVDVSLHTDQSHVTIEVTDDGPGIAPEEQLLLFQPFERLGAERSHVQGTGLGLALCRQLTTAMGGTIGVRSSVGNGATFHVTLARADGADRTATVRASSRAVLGVPATAHTVLYVEDNLATIALVESIFALRPNIRLITAMQGGMAVELAREQQPDLVILDLHLPDINGEEVIHRLRDDPRTAEIPVVMYSADATERQVDRVLAAGAQAYLTKPARVSEFLGMLDRTLESGRRRRQAGAAEISGNR